MYHIDYLESDTRYDRESSHRVEMIGSLSRYGCANNQITARSLYVAEPDGFGSLEERLQELTAEWVSETRYLSSLDDLAGNPAYKEVIRMGADALPFIFNDLRTEPKPWFVALRKITGSQPIPKSKAGKFRDMVAIWLKWAESHGY